MKYNRVTKWAGSSQIIIIYEFDGLKIVIEIQWVTFNI